MLFYGKQRMFYCICFFIFFTQSAFAVDYIQDAKKYFDNSEYSAAIIQLKNQLKDYPRDASARNFLGTVYLKIQERHSAEKELGRAYKLEPDNESYRLDYARALLNTRKYDKVSDLLRDKFADAELEKDRLNILGSIAFSQNEYDQAEDYFLQAREKGLIEANLGLVKVALYKKEFKKANELLDELIKLEPDNILAWEKKALILNLSQEYQQAIDIYTRLLTQHENHYGLYLQRASSYLTINKLSEAEADIEFVLKHLNNLPLANILMSKLRFKQKNYERAEFYAAKVLNDDANNKELLYISGSSNLMLKRYNLAEKRYLEYLSQEPDNIKAHIMLATIYLTLNKTDNAILILDGLPQDVQENNIMVLTTLTYSYLLAEQYDQAIKNLQQALKVSPHKQIIQNIMRISQNQANDVELLKEKSEFYRLSYKDAKKANYLLLAMYFQEKRFAEFKKKLAEFINQNKYDPYLYVIGANFELSNNEYEAAKVLFNKAITVEEQNIPALKGLAVLAFKDKDYPLARSYYKKIITIDQNNVDAYYSLAQLAEQEGDLVVAEDYLRKIYELNQVEIVDAIKAAKILVGFFDKHKMPLKKETLANSLLKSKPDDLLALAFTFDIQLSLGQYQQAEKTLRVLIDKDKDNINYHLLLAKLLSAQAGREDETLQIFEKTYSLNRNTPIALVAKHNYQVHIKRYKNAMRTAKQVQNDFPSLNLGEEMAGNVYLLMGKSELALESYQKGFQIQADAKLTLKIAKLMGMLKRENDAELFLQKQLDNPRIDSVPVLHRLAAMSQDNKNYHQAAAYYQQLLRKKPEEAGVLNNLAWNYMQLNDPQAIILAEKAYNIQPESANYADTYGTILLKNNKLTEAVSILSKAVELAPENKAIQFHLAEAYSLQEDKDKAVLILKKITQASDSFSEKKAAEKLLEELNP